MGATLTTAMMRELGSVEGILEWGWGQPRKRTLAIQNFIDGQIVECYFPTLGLYNGALPMIGKRVCASGLIVNDDHGAPIHVRATEIMVFPESEDLATADDVYGILGELDEENGKVN